jgi:dihydroorotate dehydrogenase
MPGFYDSILRPLLFRLDPESAHEKAISLMEWASRERMLLWLLRRMHDIADPRLKISLFGLSFPNPVGLAAGFDKNAVAFPALAALGFGFVEVGTVTGLGQPGNPKPRMFRLPEEQALLNRLGFNNDGAETVRNRLATFSDEQRQGRPLGINLGKSKIVSLDDATADYLRSFRLLKPFGDYFVVNVSSPNTPELRKLQDKERLDELLDALQRDNNGAKPILVKIAPDLSFEQMDDVLGLIEKHKMRGIIATNTTVQRPGIPGPVKDEQGGLSGRPVRELANDCIRHLWKQTKGRVPIIGVGGVFTAEDAYEKIKLGASLVQVYTGFVYGGPGTAARINRGLLRLMEHDGVKQISELIGKA